MYVKVGEMMNLPLLEIGPLCWNPPGWGSVAVEYPGAALGMVIGIKPGGMIPLHRDNPAAENGLGETPLARFHVPLDTNPGCWNFHDGSWQQLQVGSLYQMDPFLEHASVNLGPSIRLHLVIDLPIGQTPGENRRSV